MDFYKKRNYFSDMKRKQIFVGVFLSLVSFFIVMQSSNTIWHKGDVWTDSAVFKYVAWELQDGNMPYLDTFDHKGPLIYFINIIGNMINWWRGIWVVEFVSMFIGIAFIYKIARLYCDSIISASLTFIVAGCVFKYFEGGNLVEEYAISFIAIGIFVFIKYLEGHQLKKYEILICGVSFSCILLLRPNMAVLWPVMCLGIMVKLLKNQQYKELINLVKWFSIGLLAVLIPVLLWLMINGAFSSFIDAYFEYNMKYTKAMSQSYSRYSAFSHYISDYVVLIVACESFLVTIIRRRYIDLLYFTFFVLNILMISMAGKISMHYGMIIVPTLIYPLAVLSSEFRNLFVKGVDEGGNRIGAEILLILIIIPYVFPQWMTCIMGTLEQYKSRNALHITASNVQIAEIVKDNTDLEDEISVCGNWNIIYLLSERKSSSRYSYQTVCSIDEEMTDDYFMEMEDNPPEVIVLRNDFWSMEKMTRYLASQPYVDVGGDDEGVARVLKRSRLK